MTKDGAWMNPVNPYTLPLIQFCILLLDNRATAQSKHFIQTFLKSHAVIAQNPFGFQAAPRTLLGGLRVLPKLHDW